ncbi:MAG TPA: energy transducer TonB [Sphingomicrobium sp.]|nr:energy transducer TonB [Sphingomicrobium sp.]
MLAYAANAPRIAERRSAPNALLFIIAGHVAVVAAVMSAKMDLPRRILEGPLVVTTIPVPPPPPSNPIRPKAPTAKVISAPEPQTSIPPTHLEQDPVEALGPTKINTVALGEGGFGIIPEITRPVHYPVKLGPRLATPESELKPPYPQSKLLTEEEAVLNLKLTIDQNGRVVAVDPVGRADPAFLSAARRHLLAHWRYRPASEDGQAVTSSTVITLRFQLNG